MTAACDVAGEKGLENDWDKGGLKALFAQKCFNHGSLASASLHNYTTL